MIYNLKMMLFYFFPKSTAYKDLRLISDATYFISSYIF